MSLDRQLLAKIDRRLLSELDHTEGVQLVKVPVSDAVWSAWRRYCDAVGLSMGRGLAVLLQGELASVVDEDLIGLVEMLEVREANIAAREAELAEWEASLERRKRELALRERQLASGTAKASRSQSAAWAPPKLGRNQPCWCGSDKKFKYCHGASAR